MEDLKKIQEFFSKPLNEVNKEDAWKKFQKEKFVTDKTIQAARKDFEKEWEAGKLKEGTFDQGEIAIYIGHDDSGTTHIFKRGSGYYGYNDEFDFEAASKEELQQMLDKWGYELLAGSLEESVNEMVKTTDFKHYQKLKARGQAVELVSKDEMKKKYDKDKSVNEAEYTDYSNKELAAYCKNNPTDKKAAKELHKRSQALKGLTRTDVNEGAVEIMDAFNDVMDLVKKHSRNLNDDDSYAFALKLKAWFNKNIISEDKKLTYNDFVRMVRDDMMAGAAPDERPSEELVGKRAKAYYNDYLQGASVDDLFEAKVEVDNETEFKLNLKHLLDKHVVEATKEEETEFHTKLDKLVHDTFGKRKDELEEGASTEEKRIAMSAIKRIAKYRGVSEDEARNDLIRAAKEIGSLKEAVKDIFETIQLGKNLNEELCAKGKAYIKKRQAAGEKSSAYLSGRAVKVCKGQMKG